MKIYTETPEGTTVIQNSFIDQYMPHANGEYVKVYLYLLRCANTGRELSLSSIADVFEHTEKDIQRALAYWEKQYLMKLKMKPDGAVISVTFMDPSTAAGYAGLTSAAQERDQGPVITGLTGKTAENVSGSGSSHEYRQGQTAVSGYGQGQVSAGAGGYGQKQTAAGTGVYGQKQTAAGTGGYGQSQASAGVSGYGQKQSAGHSVVSSTVPSPERVTALSEQQNLRQLFFIAEQYLQRPLNSSEQSDFIYYYDTLKFSTDLIEYLLEYCISKGSASRHYMKKVALAWAEAGITTVMQAKQETNLYNKNYFTIMNAFGIKGRNPAAPELEYMSRWINEYGFTMDIILEACRRTICQTHQPNFQYADKILSQWREKKVTSAADIQKLDLQRLKEKAKPAEKPPRASGNRFNNFTQRDYDYDKLERQLLNQ